LEAVADGAPLAETSAACRAAIADHVVELERAEAAGEAKRSYVAYLLPKDGEGGEDVKKLVPKKETVVWLTPSEEQIQAYKKILEKSDVIREACSKQKLGIEVFRAIGLLKRLCNHPMILVPTPKRGAWAGILSDAIASQEQHPLLQQQEEQEADAEGLAVTPCAGEAESLAASGASSGAVVENDDARAGQATERARGRGRGGEGGRWRRLARARPARDRRAPRRRRLPLERLSLSLRRKAVVACSRAGRKGFAGGSGDPSPAFLGRGRVRTSAVHRAVMAGRLARRLEHQDVWASRVRRQRPPRPRACQYTHPGLPESAM